MIKLIVSDLDGTLVNEEKKFAPDFFEVLEKLNAKGIKFVIASGRSRYTLEKVFQPHENEIYYISDNGAYIYGKDIKEILYPLSYKQAQKTVSKCLAAPDVQIIMCAKDKAYFVRPNKKYVNIINEYYINYEIIEDYTQVTEQILKIAVFDPHGSAQNGYPKVKDHLDKELVAVVSAQNWFDVMNKKLNKGVALKKLQNHFKITKENTMVFGDFYNDIEMLKCAKYSFAMANSNVEVKKSANFIADTNENFGVVKVIKEYINSKI